MSEGRPVIPRSEREPVFEVAVVLDGDDWPPTATEAVQAALEETVAAMKADGLIRAGSVTG